MLYFFLDPIKFPFAFYGLIPHIFGELPVAANIALTVVYVLIAYLLGSFNTGIFISKKMYNDDIRNYGSGNAGFTNVMRVYGGKAAIITFFGDILKTIFAILVGWCFFGYINAYIAALACFIGHIYPVFYNFKGGKGVVCMISLLAMLDWRIVCIITVIFLATLLITKYMSLSSVMVALTFPIFLNRLGIPVYEQMGASIGFIQIITIIIGIIVVFKHRKNLVRVFNGTESKFKLNKSKKNSESEETAGGNNEK